RLRRSRMLQPSTTGSWMSRVMAAGCSSFARASPVSPRVATTALKPFSRAIPTRIRANFTSSSMIKRMQSPSRRRSRSSSIGRWTHLEEARRRLSPRLFALAKLLRLGASPRAGRVFLWLGLRSDAGIGQVQDEGAALSRFALHLDLAAEQAGDLARDGKTQSG